MTAKQLDTSGLYIHIPISTINTNASNRVSSGAQIPRRLDFLVYYMQ